MNNSVRPAAPSAPPALLPLALLFVLGMSWGIGVALVKYGTAQGIPAFGYLFWVALGAGCVAFVICLARGSLPACSPAHLRYYVIIGGLRLAGANLIFYSVVKHIPVGVMAVILGTAAIFTYAMALALRMEKFQATRIAGILLGLAGVVLFVAPRQSLPDPAMTGWVMLGVCSPILYSIANIVIVRLRPSDGDSVSYSVGMLWAAALLVLPVMLATDQFYPFWQRLTWADGAMALHTVINGLAFFGLFELIQIAGPTYAAQLTYIVTLSGVVFGIVLFGETPTIWVWAGTALVLAGVTLVNIRGGGGCAAG